MATRAEISAQKRVAKEWVLFRTRFLFSQKNFALALGISRRAVQYVESGNGQRPGWLCMPHADTLARFKALKSKHEKEAS